MRPNEIHCPDDEARAVSEIGTDHIDVLVGDGELPRERPITSGWVGGLYQWERIEDAKAFYTGPWASWRKRNPE
jgi:hypothetical protein